MTLPFEGAYCSLALRSWGGLPILIDPHIPGGGGPHPLSFGDAEWDSLAELYRRS